MARIHAAGALLSVRVTHITHKSTDSLCTHTAGQFGQKQKLILKRKNSACNLSSLSAERKLTCSSEFSTCAASRHRWRTGRILAFLLNFFFQLRKVETFCRYGQLRLRALSEILLSTRSASNFEEC